MEYKCEEVKSLNAHLKNLELQVYEVYHAMIDQRVPVTASGLKSLLISDEGVLTNNMLVPIFEQHNTQVAALVGKEYAQGRWTGM